MPGKRRRALENLDSDVQRECPMRMVLTGTEGIQFPIQ